jgi:hypothetical protein
MNIHNYIQSLDLQIEEGYRGDCPECNGTNTFTAIKTTENILYNCYKVGCRLRGNSSYQFTVSDALIRNKKEKGREEIFTLPTYVTPNMERIIPWAKQYGIDGANLLYDVKENRIVFPVVHNNKTVDATGRAINKKHKPKWKRYGSSGHAYISGLGEVAVVVEDCISAAVVPTIDTKCTGFALMGTSLLAVHIEQLQNYSKVIVALDPDAVQKTFEFTRNLRGFLTTSSVCAMKLEDDLKYRRKNDIINLELHIH